MYVFTASDFLYWFFFSPTEVVALPSDQNLVEFCSADYFFAGLAPAGLNLNWSPPFRGRTSCVKEILEQLTNDEITPDEALANLEGLGWDDAIFYWGFVDDEGISTVLEDHNDDFQWLKNFLEDLDPEQEWHYVDGNGWCDDTEFKDTVIDFINDHLDDDE